MPEQIFSIKHTVLITDSQSLIPQNQKKVVHSHCLIPQNAIL